jgi:hypothetical protein
MVECVAFLLRIRKVPGSSVGPETGNPEREFCGFSQSFQENPRPFPSVSFPIRYSQIIVLFDAA